MDAAPSNRNLSNCEKNRVYNRKKYVAWIFDRRMNQLYDSNLEMIPRTDQKKLQHATSQIEKPTKT
jgi:hypothetical protein